jgi:DNA-binding MarR family transcriptional regulator
VSKQLDDPRELAARAVADLKAANDAVDAAAAAMLGINRTDLRILGLLLEAGTLAAGPLAEAAHLSPAATSTAIQRLMAAGYLSRDRDERDGRRAVVRLTPSAVAGLDRIYAPIRRAGLTELARYSDDEIAVIVDFLGRGRRMQLHQADRIRGLNAT